MTRYDKFQTEMPVPTAYKLVWIPTDTKLPAGAVEATEKTMAKAGWRHRFDLDDRTTQVYEAMGLDRADDRLSMLREFVYLVTGPGDVTTEELARYGRYWLRVAARSDELETDPEVAE